ncbi:MAG: ABC transporter ATP-binding protein/permease, partial [Gemmataceae bacterium]|nr:ABC transporter ATP-binding protein/permease [Gemmataceae bacterium]
MGRQAFARAVGFLNYFPVAKWSALTAAVAAEVLFGALLALLGLFIDLAVEQGELPSWEQLPANRRERFEAEHSLPTDAGERQARVKEWEKALAGLTDDAAARRLVAHLQPASLPEALQRQRWQLLWLARLPAEVEAQAGEEAADEVRAALARQVRDAGLAQAMVMPLADFGLLSLVVRAGDTWIGDAAALAARYCSWTWRYGNQRYLRGLFFLAVGIAVVRYGLILAGQCAAALTTLEAMTRLRRAVYLQTYRLGALAIKSLGPSEAISISTRHLEVVHQGLYAWLTVVFREPIKLALLLAFAMIINLWLAWAFVLFALLVWAAGGQVASYFRRQVRRAEERAAEQMVRLQESLKLLRLVKVYVMEHFNQTRVERQLTGYAQATLRRYRGEALQRQLFLLLGLLAALVLLLLAGTVLLDGRLPVAYGLTMVAALVCLYWPTSKCVEARRTLRRAREAAKVLFDFLDRPGSVGQAVEAEFLPPLSDSIEFDQVTLQEPGTGRALLRGVNLTISAGQKIALVGTDQLAVHALVYLIPRFLDPQEGEVRIDGKNLRWVTLDSLRIQIAMVLQHDLVFNDTIANNIGCGDPTYPLHRIVAAAKVAHAHNFIQKLPLGYQTVVGDLGHALSATEQFRIALARAILREPTLLIIEEPP